MNSRNIYKKRLNSNSGKQSNRILNYHHDFKTKKKRYLSNFLKENLITNWIENKENKSRIELNFLYKNSYIKLNNDDKDSLEIENLQRLSTMKNIIFLDLENFSRFFQHLTTYLPNYTYVIAFQSSNIQWKPPINDSIYKNLLNLNNFQLMRRSGNRHDAADFALVLTFGKLHGLLPKSISFTIISGDKGFIEIINQLKYSLRRINWFNPHQISLQNFNQILYFTSTDYS